MEQTAFDFSWTKPAEVTPNLVPVTQTIERPKPVVTMADIQTCVTGDPGLAEGRRRDLLSGLSRFGTITGRPISDIPATASAVRAAFADANPVKLGIKQKSLQTLRSSVAFALKRYGNIQRGSSPVKRNWSPEWADLIGRIQIDFQRHALSRFAAFCSQSSIAPTEVTVETLGIFLVTLTDAEIVKNPKEIVHGTISSWNRAVRDVPGWPQIRLYSPTRPTPFVRKLEDFPASFQADIRRWEARASLESSTELFDDAGIPKALRPATVDSRTLMFRTLATALVKSGARSIDELEDLNTLCHPENLLAALKLLFSRGGVESKRRISVMANNMRLVAKHYCDLDDVQLRELSKLCDRIHIKRKVGLTARNRARLDQLDFVAYDRLRQLPLQEAKLARSTRNPYRAAKAMERAVMICILLNSAPRVTTLRQVELGWLVWRPNGEAEIHIPERAMKSGRAHELVLSAANAKLLQEFIDRFRPSLPCATGPYLFPGENGGPRSKNAAYEAIRVAAERAGFEINPHLYRHILQKVASEADPSSAQAVAAVLGHQSVGTTFIYYGGANGFAAGRQLDKLLSGASAASSGGV